MVDLILDMFLYGIAFVSLIALGMTLCGVMVIRWLTKKG